MSDLVTVGVAAQTAVLVIASLLLAYPLVAYGRYVAHTGGLALLTAALVATTASHVAFSVFEFGVVSAALDLAGALSLAAATWTFARPFVRFDDAGRVADVSDDLGASAPDEPTGGFERAEE
ncbi:hypothetical protein [Halorussus marinus]|uniref:hypothetical protein n=1 Tax=Halorussus marinus TaxID=2505976 RepID=UPI001091D027|nr:hypothetical protein [Halorussus marinus]